MDSRDLEHPTHITPERSIQEDLPNARIMGYPTPPSLRHLASLRSRTSGSNGNAGSMDAHGSAAAAAADAHASIHASAVGDLLCAVPFDSATEPKTSGPHVRISNDGADPRPSRMRIQWNGCPSRSAATTASPFGNLMAPLKVAERPPSGVRIDCNNVEGRVLKVLKQFDVNDNDTLDIPEVTALVEHLLNEERQTRHLKAAIIGLICFTVILLATMTGLTYAIVATLKDTKVSNDAILVTNSGNTIQVASTDMLVSNGLLMNRFASGNAALTAAQSNTVLRVSSYSGLAQGINSVMNIDDLMELNYLHVYAPSGEGELALRVNGVARKPMPQSFYGTVVDILTSAGTIVLDGSDIFFEQQMENVFTDAGFNVGGSSTTGQRRRLLDDNTLVTGRYNRLVDVLPPPPVANEHMAQAWLISALTKEEAQDATNLLAALSETNASESEYATMWHDYKAAYGKVYATMKDDLAAFRIWIKNMLQVINQNIDDTLPYWTSPNAFSDMEFNAFVATVLMSTPPPNASAIEEAHPNSRRRMLEINDGTVAKEVDWVAAGKVTPVRNQGGCGSCWAFAGVAAVESALLISVPLMDVNTLHLSEQQVVNCANTLLDPYFVSMGCLGGDPFEAISLTYFRNLTTETIMPYVSGASSLDYRCDTVTLRNTKVGQVARLAEDTQYVYPFNDEKTIMQAVMVQPIAGYFMVDETFLNYAGGIYTPTTCTTATNHNFLIVGYNTSAPIPYWRIKNQWGAGWGEKGFARIAMTADLWGPCGMYQFTAFPNLNFSMYPPPRVNGSVSISINGGANVAVSGSASAVKAPPMATEQASSPPPSGLPPEKAKADRKNRKKNAKGDTATDYSPPPA